LKAVRSMSSKSNIIVGLDIGTSYVSIVVGEALENSDIRVLGIGRSPSLGLRKGVVINIESTVESISKAISEAESSSGIELSSVYASIGGGHIKSFNSHGIVGIRGKEVTEADIDRVIEAAKAIAIPNDREILHVLPQQFVIDGQDGIKEPLGMSGVRLEARVHVVTGSVSSAQNIVKCANRCGLTVKDIVLSSLASAETVLSQEEKELGVCLIDIGGGTTDLLVFCKGAVRHTAVLSIGGSHITGDIASGLRTPVSAAEAIKVQHGSALANEVQSDEIVEVPSTGGRPARVLSRQVLCEIIQPRMEEILTLAQKELIRSECDELLTSGIVLSGGGAALKGISDIAQRVFNLPIRLGVPMGMSGAQIIRSPEFATALGLLRFGAKSKQYTRYHAQNQSPIKKLIKRVNEWFSDSD